MFQDTAESSDPAPGRARETGCPASEADGWTKRPIAETCRPAPPALWCAVYDGVFEESFR